MAPRNVWFTADFHLGHQNIIRYCQRPFASAAEMGRAIIDRLNERVGERDILNFLGDFCLGSGKHATEYLKQIRCQNIHFIEGNHDKGARQIHSSFAS